MHCKIKESIKMEYVIEGVETNIPLLKEIISKDDFINGSFDINWMGKL